MMMADTYLEAHKMLIQLLCHTDMVICENKIVGGVYSICCYLWSKFFLGLKFLKFSRFFDIEHNS